MMSSPPDPHAVARTVRDLSLVEIASELESVTAQIEQHRAREREARAEYETVAREVNEKIEAIRERAASLVDEQHRRMSSFGGIIRKPTGSNGPISEPKPAPPNDPTTDPPRTLGDAILRVFELEDAPTPLNTEELTEGIAATGYKTRAAPKSLKSSLNQAIAKLCQEGSLLKYRSDGTPIDPREHGVRARRYLPPAYADEHPALAANR